MSPVKVGDRVRATCGENVIVGTVKWVNDAGTSVGNIDALYDDNRYYVPASWTVEVLPPPVPDVVGTIVRDRIGDAWLRTFYGWDVVGREVGAELADVESAYGPLTVLWTLGDAT